MYQKTFRIGTLNDADLEWTHYDIGMLVEWQNKDEKDHSSLGIIRSSHRGSLTIEHFENIFGEQNVTLSPLAGHMRPVVSAEPIYKFRELLESRLQSLEEASAMSTTNFALHKLKTRFAQIIMEKFEDLCARPDRNVPELNYFAMSEADRSGAYIIEPEYKHGSIQDNGMITTGMMFPKILTSETVDKIVFDVASQQDTFPELPRNHQEFGEMQNVHIYELPQSAINDAILSATYKLDYLNK